MGRMAAVDRGRCLYPHPCPYPHPGVPGGPWGPPTPGPRCAGGRSLLGSPAPPFAPRSSQPIGRRRESRPRPPAPGHAPRPKSRPPGPGAAREGSVRPPPWSDRPARPRPAPVSAATPGREGPAVRARLSLPGHSVTPSWLGTEPRRQPGGVRGRGRWWPRGSRPTGSPRCVSGRGPGAASRWGGLRCGWGALVPSPGVTAFGWATVTHPAGSRAPGYVRDPARSIHACPSQRGSGARCSGRSRQGAAGTGVRRGSAPAGHRPAWPPATRMPRRLPAAPAAETPELPAVTGRASLGPPSRPPSRRRHPGVPAGDAAATAPSRSASPCAVLASRWRRPGLTEDRLLPTRRRAAPP